MQSYALLEALRQKLKARIRYFCQILHIGINEQPFKDPVILCLGEHSMFVLNDQMTILLGEIFYAHITRLIEQRDKHGPQDVLRLEISDERPRGIPAKMTIISSEKDVLVRHIKCYWETDYMWRLGKIGNMWIDKEKIDLKRYKAKAKESASKERYLYPSTSSRQGTIKGFGYFVPNYLNVNPRVMGEYEGQDDKANHYILSINVEDAIQLEFIKDDIRSKAEEIAEGLLTPGEDFWYLKNNPYMKRMNLVMDLASWRGWEILLVTPNRHIAVVLMRRKFIPPLMDSGQDIVFICKGGPNARIIALEPADSIYSTSISNEFYFNIIKPRCDALIFDEEAANFYQIHLNIKPERIYYAYQFMYSIMRLIEKDSNDPHIKNLIKEVEAMHEAKITQRSLDQLNSPERIIIEFQNSTASERDTIGYKKWCEKVCRYLAYCIDGGLLQSRFTLEDVIEPIMKGTLKDTKSLNKLKIAIKEMLAIKKRSNEKDEDEDKGDDIYPLVNRMLEDAGKVKGGSYAPNNYWMFNEKVMIGLIECGYLQRELEISGDLSAYPKLLIYLLERPGSSIDLKSAICRVTVGVTEAQDLQMLKILIPHLLEVYAGRNYTLATQAAISLVNLSYNNRENKQTLYQARATIVKRLSCKDQKLLAYSVLMILNLATESSRRRNISREILGILKGILMGNGALGNKYNAEVLSRCLQAITVLSKDHSTNEQLCADEKLITSLAGFIGYGDESEEKMLILIENMAEKNPFSKTFIGKLLIERLIKRIMESPNAEIIKAIIMAINILVANHEDNFTLFKEHGGADALEGCLQNPGVTVDPVVSRYIQYLRDA